MKLPSFRRLITQDYPKEFQKLIDTLSVSLNNGIEVLYQALNNQITLRENIKSTVKDIILSVDANGVPTQQAAFTLDVTGNIDLIMVGLAVNQTNSSAFPTSGVFLSWSQNTNTIIINHVTGLQANQQYLLRVVAFNR